MQRESSIQAIKNEEFRGFLKFARTQKDLNHLSIKIGGTAMKEIMENGQESQVLKAIKELKEIYGKKIVLVVSAPGKYLKNKQKITQRLIHALNLLSSENKNEAHQIIQQLKEDHLKMVFDNIPEARRNKLEKKVGEKFAELYGFLKTLEQTLLLHSGYALDIMAGFGEEIGSMILAEILTADHISTSDVSIDGNNRDLADIIDQFSIMIQERLSKTDNDIAVVSGFPGFIKGTSTIAEAGMGYTDLHCVMSVPENSFIVLLKQSGAILQANPNLLPDDYPIEQIQIMPVRQAVRMTELIADQIQVIHPMALEEAQRKKLTLMVVNEKHPFSGGGTLIVPNELYDAHYMPNKTKQSQQDTIPMLGVAENVRTLTMHFKVPTSKHRELNAINALQVYLDNEAIKIVQEGVIENDDNGNVKISFLVTGLRDSATDEVKNKHITDIKK